jgi:hypothetical protein
MNNGKGNPHARQKLEQSNIFYFSQDKKSLYEENQNNPDRYLKNWLRDYQRPIKTRTEKKPLNSTLNPNKTFDPIVSGSKRRGSLYCGTGSIS